MDGLSQFGADSAILTHLAALADLVRCRLLRLLTREELTVGDLCDVLQLPQSTVSRHLKVLSEAGWVDSRPDGTKRLYRATLERPGPSAAALWEVTANELMSSPSAALDDERLASVLARQSRSSRSFFDAEGDRWDSLRDELFGRRFFLHALVGFLDPDTTAGDLGCGSGPVAEALAPFISKVIAVDASAAMLDRAKARLQRFDQVELREGELEALPIADQELDLATLFLVLHHVQEPGAVIAEARRAMKPNGQLLILDMVAHDRERYRQEMGHRWLGFEESVIRDQLSSNGFDRVRLHKLPPDPDAKGPGLFVAAARAK